MLQHSLLFAVSIFALPTLFWRVSNLILYLFWPRTWNTTSYSEGEFVLRDDDDDGLWLGEGLESLRKMHLSWVGRDWLSLTGSVVLQPSSNTMVEKRCLGLRMVYVLLRCHRAPPLLNLRIWSVGNGSHRGTGFFLAPCVSVSLRGVRHCLLCPAGSAGLLLQEVCCVLPKAA